jgi:hypothetical protein
MLQEWQCCVDCRLECKKSFKNGDSGASDVVLVQSLWRGRLARKRYAAMVASNEAAAETVDVVLVQSLCRGRLARKKPATPNCIAAGYTLFHWSRGAIVGNEEAKHTARVIQVYTRKQYEETPANGLFRLSCSCLVDFGNPVIKVDKVAMREPYTTKLLHLSKFRLLPGYDHSLHQQFSTGPRFEEAAKSAEDKVLLRTVQL